MSQDFTVTFWATIETSYGTFDVPSSKIFTSSLNGTASDDDEAGISIETVGCEDGQEVSELGRTCDLQVVLDSEPTDEVVIQLGFNDSSEAIFYPLNTTTREFAFSTSNYILIVIVFDLCLKSRKRVFQRH